VDIRLDYRPEKRFVTMRLGIAPQLDDEDLIEEAAQAAGDADIAVVVVGSAEGTESEGYDRETMVLPGRQDELVRRVAAANPNTVVVVNTGMPVLMPWADYVAAVIQVWFPGQAFGEALAQTLLGVAEPAGRLPVTVPREEADSPVLRARPEAGDLVYREGLLVGYRGYDRTGTEPHFAFGHGLGYTDWTYESIALAGDSIAAGDDLQVAVTVRNSGARAGREVVQVYLEGPDDDPRRPIRVLAGFGTADAAPGAAVEVRVSLPARSFARFDETGRAWAWPAGTYTVRAGRSSRDLRLSGQVVMR
jgi:beta-glucosidase